MKRWFIVFVVALSMVILLSPYTPQAASPPASTPEKAATSSTTAKPSTSAKASSRTATATAAKPQTGGVWKILIKNQANRFGYPPTIVGADRDFSPPFFNRLITIGDDGNFKPELALSWNTSSDGKALTFKLRKGVKFHDGTDFNAQTVKSNFDNLIPPKANIISGVTFIEAVDDYTVKVNLSDYNNLIVYQLASNYACYMYSPAALQKNGADWAATHPVGTGPFMLKDHQPNISVTYVKNPNYWEKGLPYLDGIEMNTVIDPMTQVITFKAGQAHAIYAALGTTAAQLRDAGYPLKIAPGNIAALGLDAKNSEYFSNPKVRQAIEYAIDKEAICNGPGEGLYIPVYQIVSSKSPDYNPACPPRKYDPAKAKKLLAEAGYPNGFSFKAYFSETNWKDGFVAIQSYLANVGIKMDITYLTAAAFSPIRAKGQVEKGAASYVSLEELSNSLYVMDFYFRSNSNVYQYMVRPAGIDALIAQAKLARDPVATTRINRQIAKLIYDDQTVVPLWDVPRIAVVDKSVQDTGWFIAGDSNNNQCGTRTWLKK
jgi:peptide/nickel transport system substrate-binding protein